MPLTHLNDRDYFFNRYDSLHEMCEAVIEVKDRIKGFGHGMWTPGSFNYDTRFVGRKFDSWNHLQKETESYWKEGMDVYDRMMVKLREVHIPPPQSLKRQATWSEDDGSEIDIDKLQRGDAYWRSTQRHHRPGPVSITLATAVTTSGFVQPMDVLWRGAAAMCLIELLEQSGYRAELWAVQHCVSSYPAMRRVSQCTAVCLKQGCDPINPSGIINATSSWAYRTLFFGAYWIGGGIPTDSLGTIASIKPMVPHITPDAKTIIVEDIWSEDAATNWIKHQLQQLERK